MNKEQMSVGESKVFFGGIPTGPDVKKILEHFPENDCVAGMIIYHDQLETIIGQKRMSSRYRAVTDAWRKFIRNRTGMMIEPTAFWDDRMSVGFKVLSEPEKVEAILRKKDKAKKQLRDGVRIASITDRRALNDEQKAVLDFELGINAKMLACALVKSKVALPSGDEV